MPDIVKIPTVQFIIRRDRNNEEWENINHFLDKPDELLNYYLDSDGLSCCTMMGGFYISANDVPWNGPDTIDEFWMTATWFKAFNEILSGSNVAEVTAWEESGLKLTRDGDDIELEDRHHSGRIVCEKVRFNLHTFLSLIINEGLKFARLTNILREKMMQIAKDAGFFYSDEEQPQVEPMTDAEFEKALGLLEKEEIRIKQSAAVQTPHQTLKEKIKIIDKNLPRDLESIIGSLVDKLR